MIDFKVCTALVGEGHCCKACHEGDPLFGDQGLITFEWNGSPVCCEVWIILEEGKSATSH